MFCSLPKLSTIAIQLAVSCTFVIQRHSSTLHSGPSTSVLDNADSTIMCFNAHSQERVAKRRDGWVVQTAWPSLGSALETPWVGQLLSSYAQTG